MSAGRRIARGSIPKDVQRRAEKAGARRVDWYAGRLEHRGAWVTTSQDRQEGAIDRARTAVKQQRDTKRATQRDKRRATVSKIITVPQRILAGARALVR